MSSLESFFCAKTTPALTRDLESEKLLLIIYKERSVWSESSGVSQKSIICRLMTKLWTESWPSLHSWTSECQVSHCSFVQATYTQLTTWERKQALQSCSVPLPCADGQEGVRNGWNFASISHSVGQCSGTSIPHIHCTWNRSWLLPP